MYATSVFPPIEKRANNPYPRIQNKKERPKSALKQQGDVKDFALFSVGLHFKDGDWQVTVTSSKAAKNAVIVLVVYGSQGNSGSIILGRATQNGMFADGKQDEFSVNLAKIGKVFKIRLELQPIGSRKSSYWKPKEVKLRDLSTREVLRFKCPHALSYTEGGGGGVCELPAVRPGQPVLPVVSYTIQTHTSTDPGADTDADVYVTLFGDRGDTGRRLLMHSDNEDMFQEGQVDTFALDSVSLGPVKRLLLGHDGEGPGEGWKCAYVTVQETNTGMELYVFKCNRWMDTSMEDGGIERLLQVQRNNDVRPKGGGRDRFFNRLTGDKADSIQPFVLPSENSDLAFNRKFYTNRNKVQHAIPLSEAIPAEKEYNRASPQHPDEHYSEGHRQSSVINNERHSKKMAGYSYLKLPKIESPNVVETPVHQDNESDSDDVTLPDIESPASSVMHKTKQPTYLKRKARNKPVKQRHVKSQHRLDTRHKRKKHRRYPKVKEIIEDEDYALSDDQTSVDTELHHKKTKEGRDRQRKDFINKHNKSDSNTGTKENENIISRDKRRKNSDLWSDFNSVYNEPVPNKARTKEYDEEKRRKQDRYVSEESDGNDSYFSDSDVSVFSTASGLKLMRNTENRNLDTPEDSLFEPVKAVYVGTRKQTKRTELSTEHGERHSRNEASPKKMSRAQKYHPLVNKKSFPWVGHKQFPTNNDHRKNQSPTKQREKPKTAVVRPTQREPGKTDIIQEKQKKEDIDPLKYVPHRIEVRLAERRIRQRKRNEEGVTLPEKKSRLRKWSPKRPRSRTFTIDNRVIHKKEGVRTAVDIRKPRSRTFMIRERDVYKKEGVRTAVDIRKQKDKKYSKKDRAPNEGEPGDYTELQEEEVKLPSAIEQRIRARSLRRKNRPTTPQKETIERPVKKKHKTRPRSPPRPKPLTVPLGPFTGASRIEERIKAKKEREEQRKLETDQLLEKAKREKKKPKVVEMTPIEHKQPRTYGEKYQAKKEADTEQEAKNKPIEVIDAEMLRDEFKGNGQHPDQKQPRTYDENYLKDNYNGNGQHSFTPPGKSSKNENVSYPLESQTENHPETETQLPGIMNKNNSSNKDVKNNSGSETAEESDVPVRRKKVEFNLDQNTHGDYVPPPILRFGEGTKISSPQPARAPSPSPVEPARVTPSPSPDFKPKQAKDNPSPWAKRSYIHDKDTDQNKKSSRSVAKSGGNGKKNWKKLRAVYYVGKNRFFHDYKSNIEYLDPEKKIGGDD